MELPMDIATENHPDGFASGQTIRELPRPVDGSPAQLEALRPGSLDPHILHRDPLASPLQPDRSGDRPQPRRINWRMLLVAALLLIAAAIAPFLWNYLQSF